MSFMDMLNGIKGNLLKQKLLSMWIEPHKLEWVDFNDMQQLEDLAKTIMPEIIKNNPNIRNLLRQNSNLAGDRQKEVIDTIDKL